MIAVLWLVVCLLLVVIFKRKVLEVKIKSAIHIYKCVSRLPGPKAIPLFGNSLDFKWNNVEFSYQLEYLCRKYGYGDCGMIRAWIGIFPIVFLTRPETAKALLESPRLLTKPPEYALLKPFWGEGLITGSGEKWHARRKLLTPSFHLSVLNNYFKTFNSQAVILLDVVKQELEKGDVIDMLAILRRFSLDTITEAALGIQLNAQKGENEEFFYAVVRVFEMMFKTIRYPWLRLKFVWYGLGYGWEFDKNATILTTLTRKIVTERLREFEEMETSPTFDEVSSRKRNRLSFLDLLISLRKEHNLSVEDICEEVGTIFVAGYDTTSSSMGYLLYLLGQHPEQQEKVYEEIVEVLGDVNREIKMEDIKQLKYIDQCIKETLRLYPAVPMIGRLITEDLQVGDYTLPAGVTASVAPYSVQRDPKHWYDPEKFDPDRFAPENSIGRDPFAFIPFSAGMRNCLGQKFALMEEKVMLCRIIGNYQITTMTDDAENRGLPEITMKPERGFPLKFKLRR